MEPCIRVDVLITQCALDPTERVKPGPHQRDAAMHRDCFVLRKSKQVRCEIALGVASKLDFRGSKAAQCEIASR